MGIELGPGPVMVIGGPYSKLRATEAARRTSEHLGIPPGNVICTGDVVAYCAEPQETARAVADMPMAMPER